MKDSPPIEREIVKVAVARSAMQSVRAMARRTGAKHQATLGRIIEWFASQPDSRQLAILGGLTPEHIRELAEEDARANRAESAIREAATADQHQNLRQSAAGMKSKRS